MEYRGSNVPGTHVEGTNILIQGGWREEETNCKRIRCRCLVYKQLPAWFIPCPAKCPNFANSGSWLNCAKFYFANRQICVTWRQPVPFINFTLICSFTGKNKEQEKTAASFLFKSLFHINTNVMHEFKARHIFICAEKPSQTCGN